MVDFCVLKQTRFSDLIKWNVSELLSNKVLGKYENKSLTNYLIRSKNVIEIKDDILYKQITIHQYGEGVSLRCEKVQISNDIERERAIAHQIFRQQAPTRSGQLR